MLTFFFFFENMIRSFGQAKNDDIFWEKIRYHDLFIYFLGEREIELSSTGW